MECAEASAELLRQPSALLWRRRGQPGRRELFAQQQRVGDERRIRLTQTHDVEARHGRGQGERQLWQQRDLDGEAHDDIRPAREAVDAVAVDEEHDAIPTFRHDDVAVSL